MGSLEGRSSKCARPQGTFRASLIHGAGDAISRSTGATRGEATTTVKRTGECAARMSGATALLACFFFSFRKVRKNERKCFWFVASGRVGLEDFSGKNGNEVTGVIHARTESLPASRSGGYVGKGVRLYALALPNIHNHFCRVWQRSRAAIYIQIRRHPTVLVTV